MEDKKHTEETPVEETVVDNKAEPEKAEEPAEKESPVEALEKELADTKDKYLRMLAEYDNYRRRSQKEREGVYADAVADTVRQILPIADNIDRAVHAEGDAEAVRRGLEMIEKSLAALLGAFGIEAYGKVGDPFDPNRHNAVMHEDNPDLGENVISDVFQCGYKMGEKIIRFAMVKVAN